MKNLKKVMVLVLCVVLASSLMLTGCGSSGNPDDPNAGTWNATKAEAFGLEMGVEDVWTNGFSIELDGAGKAKINADGTSGSGKYTIDGSTISIDVQGETMSGTIEGTTMVIEDILGTGMAVYFEKQ